MKSRMAKLIISSIFLAGPGCSGPQGGELGDTKILSSFSANPSNLRISLTDAPIDDVKEVHVNVDYMQVFVSKGNENESVKIASGLGDVDLLTLRNGVLLPVQDISMPAGIEIKGIRLVLKATDNYLIMNDGSRCDLQTPSAQHSGLKVVMKEKVSLEAGASYSMVIDFDAGKSIVLQGNGGCLLKPVLKLPYFVKAELPDDPQEPIEDGEGTPVTDGDDGSQDGTDPGGTGVCSPADPLACTDLDPEDLPDWFFN